MKAHNNFTERPQLMNINAKHIGGINKQVVIAVNVKQIPEHKSWTYSSFWWLKEILKLNQLFQMSWFASV